MTSTSTVGLTDRDVPAPNAEPWSETDDDE